MARSFRPLLHPNQPTVPERHRSWCWGIIVKHIFTRSIRSTLANWTRMSVTTAESTTVWVWHSTAHYLPGQPTLNSRCRMPAVSLLQHSIRAGVAAGRQQLVGVTGLPSQHLSADWLAVAARAASPLLCLAVTFKFVCEIRGNDTSSAWHIHDCRGSTNPASNPYKWQWTLRKPVAYREFHGPRCILCLCLYSHICWLTQTSINLFISKQMTKGDLHH